VLYPFKLLGTWLHEGSHGLMMAVTGTGFDRMEVYADGSGLAYAAGAAGALAGALVASAGYMGTPLWGVAILAGSRSARSARRALAVLGGALVASAALVVSNRFGQVAIAALGASVLALALAAPPRWLRAAAHFVAAQACINAVVDIRVLFRPTLVVDGQVVRDSDAHAMARATVGSADDWAVRLWAALWLAWSLALLFATFRVVARRAGPAGDPGDSLVGEGDDDGGGGGGDDDDDDRGPVSGSRGGWIARWRARSRAAPRGGSDRGERRRSRETAPGGTDPSGPAGTAGP